MNINKITGSINTILIMAAVGAFFMGPAYGATAAFEKCMSKARTSDAFHVCLQQCMKAGRGNAGELKACYPQCSKAACKKTK